MTLKRKAPEVRKDEILAAAIALAACAHYAQVTRDQIGARIGVTGTAVQYHFGTMRQLRTAIMRSAVKRAGVDSDDTTALRVVAQGLLAKEPHAMRASAGVRLDAAGAI